MELIYGVFIKKYQFSIEIEASWSENENKLWLLRNGYTGSLQDTMQRLDDIVLVSTPDLVKLAALLPNLFE